MFTLFTLILSASETPYRFESWVLLGLLATFVVFYGFRTFRRWVIMEGNSNTDKNFIAKDPFNNLSKSHLKIESKEVPIEKAHSYTNAKATKSNIPSQKVKSKVDTKADLRKLKEIKNK